MVYVNGYVKTVLDREEGEDELRVFLMEGSWMGVGCVFFFGKIWLEFLERFHISGVLLCDERVREIESEGEFG